MLYIAIFIVVVIAVWGIRGLLIEPTIPFDGVNAALYKRYGDSVRLIPSDAPGGYSLRFEDDHVDIATMAEAAPIVEDIFPADWYDIRSAD